MSRKFKLGLNISQNDILLGAAVVAAGAALYLAVGQPAFGQPSGANAVSLAVNPSSVVRGSPVNASATFTRDGNPVSVSNAYLRVLDQSGAVVDQQATPNVATVNKVIDTTPLPAGTYIVEISDNASYQ